jgi:hypothetical protein
MAKGTFTSSRFHWFSVLCIAAIVLGLAAHLVADATCGSPDLAGVSQCSANANGNSFAGRQSVTCSLLAGSLLPGITTIGSMPTMVFVLVCVGLTLPGWLAAPPVHPPDHAPLIA